MNRQSIRISILAALLCCSTGIAQAKTVFDSGVQHYNQGQYAEAVVFLKEAVADEPGNQSIHYYLANTLVHLGQRDEAFAEYEMAYKLNPKGQVGRFCKQAMDAYHNHQATSGNDTADGVTPVSYTAPPRTQPVRGNIVQAESLIRRQADYEKEKHQMVGESWAQDMVNQAEDEVARIEEQAEQDIDRALTPQPAAPGSLMQPFDPEQARAKADEIRRLAEEAVDRARTAAEEKADQYRQWSKEKQYALDEVVANLESQLESMPGHSGVQLQALGTDLYVRYYGSNRTQPTAVRIVEQKADQKVMDGDDSNTQDNLPDGKRAVRSVRGKLLQ